MSAAGHATLAALQCATLALGSSEPGRYAVCTWHTVQQKGSIMSLHNAASRMQAASARRASESLSVMQIWRSHGTEYAPDA